MTPWMSRGPHAERGSAAVSTVLLLALMLTVGAAAVIGVTDLAAATAHARTAADAAALAAAGTSPLVPGPKGPRGRPEMPADAARRVAEANDARLLTTQLDQWPLRVTVEVQVQPVTAWVRRAAGPITATATAAVRPRDG